MDPNDEPAAFDAIQKAMTLAPKVSGRERAYIEALSNRYGPADEGKRSERDANYADAMRTMVRHHPMDADAAVLFAEALMNLHPWDYWTREGRPQPWTLEITAVLEGILKRHPDHPGACHYYIHAVEASPRPERALPCAKRLPALMPGAGHLVHMPAHTYMRMGLYREAEEANRHAIAVDEAYLQDRHPEGFYPMVYYPHNLHFLWAAASMEGRSAEALRAARDLSAQVPDARVRQIPPLEVFTPTPLYAMARFGKWDDVLREPAPPSGFVYTMAIWHYVRGLAYTAKGQWDDAAQELTGIMILSSSIPEDQIVGLNRSADLVRIAEKTLAGELSARQGQTDEAVRQLTSAVALQDGLVYDEPPAWYYPIRQSLGAVLLSAGRAKEAEGVYREDLQRNPKNGWSLYGLSQSLRAQHAFKEANVVDQQFKKAWERADVTLRASRF
jgi:tetratricopeptide (TPR) repeat protein